MRLIPMPTPEQIKMLSRWVMKKAIEGIKCPICGRHVKVYRRKITNTMARSLIEMYNAHGMDWGHMPSTITSQRADEAKLQYWGLIEEETVKRPDGGRAGWWRVTEKGVDYIRGNTSLPKYVQIYNKKLLEVEEDVTANIRDALGAYADKQAAKKEAA